MWGRRQGPKLLFERGVDARTSPRPRPPARALVVRGVCTIREQPQPPAVFHAMRSHVRNDDEAPCGPWVKNTFSECTKGPLSRRRALPCAAGSAKVMGSSRACTATGRPRYTIANKDTVAVEKSAARAQDAKDMKPGAATRGAAVRPTGGGFPRIRETARPSKKKHRTTAQWQLDTQHGVPGEASATTPLWTTAQQTIIDAPRTTLAQSPPPECT